jgi:hypothetical protein
MIVTHEAVLLLFIMKMIQKQKAGTFERMFPGLTIQAICCAHVQR